MSTLESCRVCANPVAPQAKACPHCGAKTPAPSAFAAEQHAKTLSSGCATMGCGLPLLLLLLLAVVGWLAECAGCDLKPGVEISRADYGDDWPFTVEHGRLECDRSAVYFTTPDGTKYGLNGIAKAHGGRSLDYSGIWRIDDEGMKSIGYVPSSPTDQLMVSIGPMISRGLKLCEGQ